MNLSRWIVKKLLPQMNHAYAQFGEDLIINQFFYYKGIAKPTYLDIGVLIEPNPLLANKLSKIRPRDKVLAFGIGLSEQKEADFYLFPEAANGLSTFSKEEAEHWKNIGMKGVGKINWEKIIKVPLVPVNTIIEKYFDDNAPDFISLDVEGLDLEILNSLNFKKYRPHLICVETLFYDHNQSMVKDSKIADFMRTVGYEIHADTYVNTIFRRTDI
jgi:FkbM family methyltransferase